MPKPLRVLILEDHPPDAELMVQALKRAGYAPEGTRARDEQSFKEQLKPSLDLILADYALPGFDALRALKLIQERRLDIPCIVVSGTVGDEKAAECIRLGASDYVLKDRLERLAPAIERALDQQRLQQQKREAEAALRLSHQRLNLIARVTGAVIGSAPLKSHAKELAEQVRSAFDVDACVIRAREGDELALLASDGVPEEKLPLRLEAKPGLPEKIISAKRPVAVADARQDALAAAHRARGKDAFQFLSYAGAPMVVEQEVLGIVGVYATREFRFFTDTDLEHLHVVANHIGIAIANERLYKELNRQKSELEHEMAERRRAEQRSQAFAAAGRRLSEATTVEAAAEIIAGIADELWHWDSCLMSLYWAEQDVLQAVMSMDMVDGERKRVPPPLYPGAHPTSFLRRAITEGPQLILRRGTPEFPSDTAPFGDKSRPSASLMYVPLRRGSRVTGVFSIQSYTPDAYTEEDLKTLEALADHCSGAIDRIQTQHDYQIIFENAVEGISRATPEGRFLGANPALATMLGYASPGELTASITDIGQQLHARPEDWKAYQREMEVRGEVRGFETEFLRKDGSRVWVSRSGRAVRDSTGNIVCYEAITEDISARKRADELLRKTEELYRLAISAAGAVPYSYEYESGSYSFLGEGIEALIGYTPPEVNRTLWRKIIKKAEMQGEARDLSREEAARRVVEGRLVQWRCDMQIITRSGQLRWISDSSVQRLDERGKPIGSIGILEDITERRLAVEALRVTEEMYRHAITAADAVAYQRDNVGNRYTFIGEGIRDLTGYTADEITPEIWNSLIRETVLRGEAAGLSLEEAIRRTKAGQIRYWKCDVRIRARDGSERWVADGSVRVLDEQGRATGSIGILQDITERKLAEEKIRAQARLLDLASDAICVADMDQQIIFWNKSAEKMYDWPAAEAIGESVDTVLFRADATRSNEALKHLIRRMEWTGELAQVTRAGRKFTVESRWTLVRDDQSRPRAILIINSDITERKNLEARFLRAQRLESIGTLASGIAHDLNNVLAPILMSVSLLREGIRDEENEAVLASVEASAQRGADIVKHLLTFARGIEGERIPIQPRHLINELGKILRGTFPKNINFQTRLADDLWPIKGDATQLHQVLLNLCVNARDAMPDGGNLQVTVSNIELDASYVSMNPEARPGPYVSLQVSDTGTGIAPEIIDQIFDPFFTTKPLGKGTGLGLSSTMGIVKSHGGFVTVQSQAGKGATFTAFLPALPQARTRARDAEPAEPRTSRGELILVADDEASVRNITRKTLESHGYRTLVAEDGTEALALYVQHNTAIHAVISDLAMPFMDGVALARALRKMDPKVKIIISTGHGQNEKLAELRNLGLKMFLEKPYTAEALLTRLRELLDGAPGS